MTTNKDKYKWQSDARLVYASKREDSPDDPNFLLTGEPGCGKTRFASGAAREMIDMHEIEKVIVVTISLVVCESWIADATEERVNITDDWKGYDEDLRPRIHHNSEFDGIVLTYQSIKGHVEDLKLYCSRYRTLVILDEPHHLNANEEIDSSWRPEAEKAFANAKYRLLITGTPWRTDGSRIPWVTYDDTGRVRADFTYTYLEALNDGVVRKVFFERQESTKCSYVMKGELFEPKTLMEIPIEQYSAALMALYDLRFGYAMTTIDSALEKLESIRRNEHPNAGMLIACRDTSEARAIYERLATRLGEREVVLATSKNDGKEEIEQFDAGTQQVIIAVFMVAEGTNIKRLRVGVYLTPRRSELSWRQLIGRTNRATDDPEERPFSSYWYIPKLQVFDEFAKKYEAEVEAFLHQQKPKPDKNDSDDPRERMRSSFPVDSNAVPGGMVGGGQEFTDAEMREINNMGRAYGIDPGRLALVLRATKWRSETALNVDDSPLAEPLRDIVKRKQKKIRRLASRLAHLRYPDDIDRFRRCRIELNNHFGISSINQHELPAEMLDEMIAYLVKELSNHES